MSWEGKREKRMRIIYKRAPTEGRALAHQVSPGGVTFFWENLPWIEMWEQLEFVGLVGMLHWQGLRVSTAVLVGLGQHGPSLHEGPSLGHCMTTLILGGSSSFALDNADLCPRPGLKQVCPSVVSDKSRIKEV